MVVDRVDLALGVSAYFKFYIGKLQHSTGQFVGVLVAWCVRVCGWVFTPRHRDGDRHGDKDGDGTETEQLDVHLI